MWCISFIAKYSARKNPKKQAKICEMIRKKNNTLNHSLWEESLLTLPKRGPDMETILFSLLLHSS